MTTKSLQNTQTIPLNVEGGADPADGHGRQKDAESLFPFPCRHGGLLHDTMPAHPPKISRVGDLHLRGIMVNPVLSCISLQERREHVALGHVWSDVTGIVRCSGGGWVETGSVVVCGREGAWVGMRAENSFAEPTRSSAT